MSVTLDKIKKLKVEMEHLHNVESEYTQAINRLKSFLQRQTHVDGAFDRANFIIDEINQSFAKLEHRLDYCFIIEHAHPAIITRRLEIKHDYIDKVFIGIRSSFNNLVAETYGTAFTLGEQAALAKYTDTIIMLRNRVHAINSEIDKLLVERCKELHDA